MVDGEDSGKSLRVEEAIDATFADEYNLLWETWKHIDQKSQWSLVLSGAVIGALLTVAKWGSVDVLGKSAVYYLCGCIALVMIGALLAGISLFIVSSVSSKPSGVALHNVILELKSKISDEDLYEGFLYEKAILWIDSCNSLRKALKHKAWASLGSQISLFLGVFVLGIAAIKALLHALK